MRTERSACRFPLLFAWLVAALTVLASTNDARAQSLESDAQTTPEIEQWSSRLAALQQSLKARFGIDRIYISGGSARAVLDHLYHGAPLTARDLDLVTVANRNVDASFVEQIGEQVESPQVGAFSRRDLRPRPRTNPAAANPTQYNAGYGTFFQTDDGPEIDLSVFHDESDLSLNGIFNVDKIMIVLDSNTTLSQFVMQRMRGVQYESLVESGDIIDNAHGYSDWQNGRLELQNWPEVERDPALLIIRVVRSYQKSGAARLPNDVATRIRRAISNSRTPLNRLQLVRNTLKLLEDRDAAHELAMVHEGGLFARWNQALHRVVGEQGRAGIEHLWGTETNAEQRMALLARELSFEDSLEFAADVHLANPELAQSITTHSTSVVLREMLGVANVDQQDIDAILNVNVGHVSLANELKRIRNSRALTSEERTRLVKRALIRRATGAAQGRLLAQLMPQQDAAARQAFLQEAIAPRIGTFTGVMNPVHHGHHDLVQAAIDEMVLDEIVVVPTPATTHNETPEPWEHRLEMARLAFEDVPEATVATLDLAEVFATQGTGGAISAIKSRRPRTTQWIKVMGADSLERYIERGLLAEHESSGSNEIVFVGERDGIDPHIDPRLRRWVRFHAPRTVNRQPTTVRSSTLVRARVARNESIEGLVDARVAQYIQQHSLYAQTEVTSRVSPTTTMRMPRGTGVLRRQAGPARGARLRLSAMPGSTTTRAVGTTRYVRR